MLVGQSAPDVIMTEMSQYAEWSARGALLDLTADIPSFCDGRELMPVPRQAFSRHSKFFAMPSNCSGYVLYYNSDALRQAGLTPQDFDTWESLARLAPRLARNSTTTSGTEFALLMPPAHLIFFGFGASLFDQPHQPTRVTAASPQAHAALDYMRELWASGAVVPPDVVSDQGSYQLFRDGKLALYFDGRWRVPNFLGKTRFTWDVRPVPSGPAGRVSLHGGTGLAISKNSPHPEAARRFIHFYLSENGLRHVIQGGRYVPVFREMAYSEAFLNLQPPNHTRAFSETMEEGASRYVLYAPGAAEVNRIFFSHMQQAQNEPTRPSSLILEALQQDLERWLARQKKKGLL
ncbi:MAG: extracellular solute-binding protein [Blastochloris sp.]|nr:extracellular solute-binding protein [Blastochloris sp.]